MVKKEGIYRTGKWGDARRFFGQLKPAWNEAKKKALQRIGLQGEAIVIENMTFLQSEWKDLSASYLAYKVKKGYSNKILFKTSSMFQSITSWTEGNTAYIGVKRTARNKDGEEIANIAMVMEFGSKKRNIPERPLYKPSKKELKEWLEKRDIFKEEMLKAIQKKTGLGVWNI